MKEIEKRMEVEELKKEGERRRRHGIHTRTRWRRNNNKKSLRFERSMKTGGV